MFELLKIKAKLITINTSYQLAIIFNFHSNLAYFTLYNIIKLYKNDFD